MNHDKTKEKEYTKEFFQTEAPYEYLYELKDNEIKFLTEYDEMKAAARSCGIKAKVFDNCYKSYETSAKRKALKSDNVVKLEGLDLELDSGKWTVNENGVFGLDKYYNEYMICQQPIVPVARYSNIETGVEKLAVSAKIDNQWKEVIDDKTAFFIDREVAKLSYTGISVGSANAKDIAEYLMTIEGMNRKNIPEYKSFSRLGWHENYGFVPFTKDKMIFDGEKNYAPIYDALQSKGEANEWFSVANEVRASGIVPTKIALAASFAAVLAKPCNCQCFAVYLWNGSGNGKTLTEKLAASVWGNPDTGAYIRTLESTDIGQEQLMNFLNNLPLILDEKETRKNQADLQTVIYKLTEGAGKDRGAKHGGIQKLTTWSTIVLLSGENPLFDSNAKEGAVNRLLDINTEGKKLFMGGDSRMGEITKILLNNYGFAGRKFVELLQENNAIIDEVKKFQSEYLTKLLEHDVTGKQAMAASLILATDTILAKYFFKDEENRLTIEDIVGYLATNSSISVNAGAYDWLKGWIEQYRYHFDENNKYESWGLIEKDLVYINPFTFTNACKNAGYNSRQFSGWLKEKNLIITDKGRNTKAKRVNGKIGKYIALKLNDDENDETERGSDND